MGKEMNQSKKSPTLTLLTPIRKYLISDLKGHQVACEHLLNLVTEYAQIPQKLLCLIVGRKRLGGSYLDVRNQNIVNVCVKSCGGAGDKNITIFCYLWVKDLLQIL